MKRYIELERNEGNIIQSGYSCGTCWNRILVKHDYTGDYLDCGTEDCRGSGLVTNGWVKKQVEDSERRARIAREVLLDFLPKKEKKTEEQLMKGLGF